MLETQSAKCGFAFGDCASPQAVNARLVSQHQGTPFRPALISPLQEKATVIIEAARVEVRKAVHSEARGLGFVVSGSSSALFTLHLAFSAFIRTRSWLDSQSG